LKDLPKIISHELSLSAMNRPPGAMTCRFPP
jgi:hypothetical protein